MELDGPGRRPRDLLTSALTFDVDLAASRARFRDFDPVGNRVPGAIETVVSAGVAVNPGTGLFGSVRLRYFGPRPLIEDNSVRSRSSTILNAQLGYELVNGLRIGIDVFNVLNARVSDINYFYSSRLPGEPAEGVTTPTRIPPSPAALELSSRTGSDG